MLEQTSDWLKALAIVRAEQDDAETFQRLFDEVLRGLETVRSASPMRWHGLVQFVLSWAFRRRPRHETEQLKQLAVASQQGHERRQEMETMSTALGQTWEDWLLERGEARGLSKGIAQGKAEGKAEGEILGRRETLKSLILAKFQSLPLELRQQIDAIDDIARLHHGIEQVLNIHSPDELKL